MERRRLETDVANVRLKRAAGVGVLRGRGESSFQDVDYGLEGVVWN